MYKLRLTVLKVFVEELFSFEDVGYIEVMSHDLGLSAKEIDNVIKRINSDLISNNQLSLNDNKRY